MESAEDKQRNHPDFLDASFTNQAGNVIVACARTGSGPDSLGLYIEISELDGGVVDDLQHENVKGMTAELQEAGGIGQAHKWALIVNHRCKPIVLNYNTLRLSSRSRCKHNEKSIVGSCARSNWYSFRKDL